MNASRGSSLFSFSLISSFQTILLILLISFSSIHLQFYRFNLSISGVIGPLIAGLFLYLSQSRSNRDRFHFLNQGLIALYGFSLFVFFLISLPSSHAVRSDSVYQLIFADLPQKFFAATLSYIISFYLPMLGQKYLPSSILYHPNLLFQAIVSGSFFAVLQSVLMYSGTGIHSSIASLWLTLLVMNLFPIASYYCFNKRHKAALQAPLHALPSYLNNIALVILLSCLACEYRLFSIDNQYLLTASGILFPFVIMVFNFFAECFNFKYNVQLIIILIVAPLLYDCITWFLLVTSTATVNLNSWVQLMLPRRMVAATITLLLAFSLNYIMIMVLKNYLIKNLYAVRIYLANALTSSLLCILNYILLYGGIYSYDQIVALVVNNWFYKMFICLIFLPVTVWIIKCTKVQAQEWPILGR